MELSNHISSSLNLPLHNVDNTIKLLQDDNTVPFIARYRKETTGNLDEVQIRQIESELKRLESLEARRKTILQSIDDQGKLSKDLQDKILAAQSLTELEDLYQPFRPKRRTRALAAREKGLEPLAEIIIQQLVTDKNLNSLVSPFVSENGTEIEEALAGAKDIVAELISDHSAVRQITRQRCLEFGRISSEKIDNAEDEKQVYKIYYQFDASIKSVKPHQILAINRGEKEKILRAKIQFIEEDWRAAIQQHYPGNHNSVFFNALGEAIEDSAKRLLLPSIERDIRRLLTERAEEHAIRVFAQNLKGLLSQSPMTGHFVLAIDPGFRSGSKIAVVDPTGKFLDFATIYPHPPQNKSNEAHQVVTALIKKYQVDLIVIGNGTASRETEIFIAGITKKNAHLNYLITSEAGASVYSASKIARDEFPDLDVSIRGAISIARRVQDPLAELVKINPQSIGVGQYQHDLNQTLLSEELAKVVESVVNAIGVEVNTASPALLSHVAGIGPSLAEKIVRHRDEFGPFKHRAELVNVPGFGTKSFEQSAGFLRIQNGNNPLDATAIHPESYPSASRVVELIGLPPNPNSETRIKIVEQFTSKTDIIHLAQELGIGKLTLEDILNEIARPGRDPREDLPKPLLRKDVLTIEDLKTGMELKGTIRNVVDFGAFVDLGVKTDGLLHSSKISKDTVLKVGDIIDVEILSIDIERNRIALDIKESERS